MEDFFPPTHVTFIQNVLQAIVAKDLHFWVMESYVASFRCCQAITNLAHRNAQVHHAFVAWRASNVPFSCTGPGSGLLVTRCHGCKQLCTEIRGTKAHGYTNLIEFIMWSNFAIDLKLCKEDPGDSSSRGMIADEVQDC